MNKKQSNSIEVAVGNINIGAKNPIRIQSMTDTDTANLKATLNQVKSLIDAGSELVRITVNNEEAAKQVSLLKQHLENDGYTTPIIGDFHFIGHRLLKQYPDCAKSLDKYRINPGNVGRKQKKDENFKTFIDIAKEFNKPVRIGVNAGSLDQELLAEKMDTNQKSPSPLPPEAIEKEALVESALSSAEMAINFGLPENKIIISCKVSRINQMVSAYKSLSKKCNFPLHLGLTEAGLGIKGIVTTTTALTTLLKDGIGDTIRASLTPEPNGDRTQEVTLCKEILQSLDLRIFTPTVTACPGCGRTTSTLFRELASDIQLQLKENMKIWKNKYKGSENLKVAVMGCVVNGPGESKAADIGISLPGTGEYPKAPVFVNGERITFLQGKSIASEFMEIVENYVSNRWASNRKI